MFLRTEEELVAQIKEDKENIEYYDWRITRLRDEYSENMYPMTYREFEKECAKYESFKVKCQKRIDKNSKKLEAMRAAKQNGNS